MRYLKPEIKSFSEEELQSTIIASASGFWGWTGSAGGSASHSSGSGNTSYSVEGQATHGIGSGGSKIGRASCRERV